jgi:hypothetical protein
MRPEQTEDRALWVGDEREPAAGETLELLEGAVT